MLLLFAMKCYACQPWPNKFSIKEKWPEQSNYLGFHLFIFTCKFCLADALHSWMGHRFLVCTSLRLRATVWLQYITLYCLALFYMYITCLHYITLHYLHVRYITLHCTGSVCHPVAVNLLQYRCITFRLTLTGKKMSAGLLLLLVCIALHWRWAGGSKVLEALLLLLLSVGQYLAMPHLCIDW